jgi:1,4-dihydroxy-2-naphthoate polyprenyltransferase
VALSTLIAMRLGYPIEWSLAFLSLIALMLLHFSVFLLHDFFDHYNGKDQINRKKGSRIIQRGWTTGKAVRFWGFVNLGLGALVALPVILTRPLVVGGVGLIAGLIILGYTRANQGLKDFGLGEVLISLCLGPLLTVGYSFAITGQLHRDIFAVGFVFGWLASLIFQLKNLEEMLTTYQNRSGGLIQRLGFDRAQKFISWQLLLLPVVALVLFQFLQLKFLLSFSAISLFLTCYWLERRLRQADSPMSSWLAGLSQDMAAVHFKNAVFFAILLAPAFV